MTILRHLPTDRFNKFSLHKKYLALWFSKQVLERYKKKALRILESIKFIRAQVSMNFGDFESWVFWAPLCSLQ